MLPLLGKDDAPTKVDEQREDCVNEKNNDGDAVMAHVCVEEESAEAIDITAFLSLVWGASINPFKALEKLRKVSQCEDEMIDAKITRILSLLSDEELLMESCHR